MKAIEQQARFALVPDLAGVHQEGLGGGPLSCSKCGGEIKNISFISEAAIITSRIWPLLGPIFSLTGWPAAVIEQKSYVLAGWLHGVVINATAVEKRFLTTTVKAHLQSILQKNGVASRLERAQENRY